MWQSYPQYGMGWHGDWAWWMPFHGVLWLLVVVAVIAGIVLLVRFLWHGGDRRAAQSGRRSALDILEERYARGELQREEFLQRKKDLS